MDTDHTEIDISLAKTVTDLPSELLSHVFRCLHQPSHPNPPSIDPPHIYPTESEVIRNALAAACLVNKNFNELAKPFLWQDVSVASGRGWMAVVETLMEEVRDEQEDERGAMIMRGIETSGGSMGGSTGLPDRGRDLGPRGDHRARISFAPDELTFSTARPPDPLVYHEDEESQEVEMLSPESDSSNDPTTPTSAALLVEPYTYTHSTPLSHSLPGFARAAQQPKSSYLPSILTPPKTRQQSPVRLRSRSSRSRSRSRSFNNTTVNPPIPPSRTGRASGLQRSETIPVTSKEHSTSRSRSRAREEPYVETIASRLSNFADSFLNGNDEKGKERAMSDITSPPRLLRMNSDDRGRSRGRSSGTEHSNINEDMEWTFDDSALSWDGDGEEVEDNREEGMMVETPGRYIQVLSFSNFRTTGTYRTLEEAVRGKFVTSGRVEGVLKNAPNLRAVAFTEYVDSCLSLPVLTELFFRGYGKPSNQFNTAALQLVSSRTDYTKLPEYVPYEPEPEDEEWERRGRSAKLEALDLTGCVSGVFGEGMERFISGWLDEPGEGYEGVKEMLGDDEPVERVTNSRRRSIAVKGIDGFFTSREWVHPLFTGLQRLSLRGCVTLSSHNIASLMASLPGLTHLDLSFTRVCPITLANLSEFPDMRLKSLSLARSSRLTSEAIRDFLIDAPAASCLEDLNLFGDQTYSSPLTPEDLWEIITKAPCFKSGNLRYLDLSSSPITSDTLSAEVFPAQPKLRSLGLSFIPDLLLDQLARFLKTQAPNVEILTLISSATRTDLPIHLNAMSTTLTLHSKLINPLASPPWSVNGSAPDTPTATRLRVVELNSSVRRALGPSGGSQNWRVVKSKGGRGWYCDVYAGWQEELDPSSGMTSLQYKRGMHGSPWSKHLASLVAADGRVASNIGWHSRKMEVLAGYGMLGREEGLYGAGAFAFEG